MVSALKLSFVLSLLGAVVFLASPAHAQQQTLTGWFTMTIVDYQTEDGLTAETTYFLTEDSGERHELLIDIELMRPLGGPVALNRKRVEVEGEWEQVGPDASAQFWVHSIRLASPEGKRTTPEGAYQALQASAREAVTGSQAWVTILCRFGDARNVTPHPVSYYEKLMGASYPALGHYWNEVSYGNIPDLRGSRVVGWYNLPRPRSYYVYDQDGDGGDDFDTGRLTEDCIAAGDADVFFPDFWGINLIFNRHIGVGGFGSSNRLTQDGQTRFWGVTAISGNIALQGLDPHPDLHQLVAHEMGHAFGLQHSSGPYGQDDTFQSSTTYDSRWDVMSGGNSFDPYPGFGSLGVHTIAYHKDFLGWIPARRKYVAPRNSTRTITLERLAQPGSSGYLLAQIPIGDSTTDFYTVETRLFAGYDDGIPDEAIVIHKVDTTRGDRLAQVVDIDNNGDTNDEGAMWTPGEIFTDPANGIQVSVDSASSTGYRVTINTDPTTITTCSEAISPTSGFFGPDGGAASVQVEAAGGCTWSATSNADWIRITSGGKSRGSGRISYAVAPNSTRTARIGTLTIGGWTFTVTQAGVGSILFEDDMESGANPLWTWNLTCDEDRCSIDAAGVYSCEEGACQPAGWALTTASSHSGTHAWTDSPGGNYPNDHFSILWLNVDLTEFDSAALTFWHRYDFASGDSGSVVVERQTDDAGRIPRNTSFFTGTSPGWELASIDLTPFVGGPINISFQVWSDATETADGWYIDDVAVFSTEPPPPPRATLENPSPNSFQSGISVISGWACEAQEIVIELNGIPLPAAYGTEREPAVQQRCGHSDAGFSLLWNWNNLGAGTHTVRALADRVEFANTTVQVTTFGEPFMRGASGRFDLSDFPTAGETTVVQWEESLQNFVITDGQPNPGGGYSQVAGVRARLENPSLGSAQSGISAISGWACEAEKIVIELNGLPLSATYGTEREAEVEQVCGHSDAGFGLLWNWNNLGAGTHTVRALADGVEFANTTVRVTTFGEPFRRGLSGTFPIPDFPRSGENKRLRWEESLQNFVITP